MLDMNILVTVMMTTMTTMITINTKITKNTKIKKNKKNKKNKKQRKNKRSEHDDPWFYKDDGGTVFGPFPAKKMAKWRKNNKFPSHFSVSRNKEGPFMDVSTLGPKPFRTTSASLSGNDKSTSSHSHTSSRIADDRGRTHPVPSGCG